MTPTNDTSTSVQMLEEESLNVLKFIASNGLVANASKTALIFLNIKAPAGNATPLELESIMIGEPKVTQTSSAKLLGMTLDENHNWNSHITGQGGLISSLNTRLFLIKRLSNFINKDRLFLLLVLLRRTSFLDTL